MFYVFFYALFPPRLCGVVRFLLVLLLYPPLASCIPPLLSPQQASQEPTSIATFIASCCYPPLLSLRDGPLKNLLLYILLYLLAVTPRCSLSATGLSGTYFYSYFYSFLLPAFQPECWIFVALVLQRCFRSILRRLIAKVSGWRASNLFCC